MSDIHPYIQKAETEFQKILHHLKDEYVRLNIGRANAALIENISVDAYGSIQPLKALSSISVTDPRTLQIQPWDKANIMNIMKAIQIADIHVNPNQDGMIIRIVLPPLTEERRKELVKVVHRMAEDARISIRSHRQDIHNVFRKMQQNDEIPEDQFHLAEKKLQEKVDAFNKQIADTASAKEKDVMTL